MTITHPSRLAALFLSCCLVPVGAMAQDEGGEGGSRASAVLLQREVGVLQTDPNATSPSCLDALKELHKTQDLVAAEESRTKDQDLEVARDVLETDFETAGQACAPDAESLCDKAGTSPSPALAKACAVLRTAAPGSRADDEEGDDEGGRHGRHRGGSDDGN
ncbi:hypothetical protein [Gluconacetobacter tumulisoli]|uniref:Secreted protein n=1 Tax=Gluconacetobacter tumulisoli TaxID=1286189 RepID=A0A7W4K978_9PROT|nr:hypothetical protein [Gluconacetobacter tumulisoli]MBB2202677.1 hypothetical protein [Gluconacetobacter tumulisoli]